MVRQAFTGVHLKRGETCVLSQSVFPQSLSAHHSSEPVERDLPDREPVPVGQLLPTAARVRSECLPP